MEFYLHFNLDMGRSPGFGSNTTDFIRPIQTRSRCGSGPEVLNLASYIHSPDHSTKGTRSPIDGLSVLVSTRFQVLFHSPPGVLFTFPSQYCSSIGHQVVFRLGGWAPRLLTGFLVSADTSDTAKLPSPFVYRTLTSYGRLFHTVRLRSVRYIAVQYPVRISTPGFASSAFARHYSQNLV